jgi:hypothetical protein
MIDSELLAKAEAHYQQLAPHVKQRETAILLKQLIDECKRIANNKSDANYAFMVGD